MQRFNSGRNVPDRFRIRSGFVVENEAMLAELPKIQRSSTENIGRVAGKTLDASETEQTKQSLLYSALFG